MVEPDSVTVRVPGPSLSGCLKTKSQICLDAFDPGRMVRICYHYLYRKRKDRFQHSMEQALISSVSARSRLCRRDHLVCK